MILGIGTDIVDINRIRSLLESKGDRFVDRILSDAEKSRIQSSGRDLTSYVARRFAAKEAFSKAVGLGIGRGVNFDDISIMNDENGKPFVDLSSEKSDFLKSHFSVKDFGIHISLSDEVGHAVAYCVIEDI